MRDYARGATKNIAVCEIVHLYNCTINIAFIACALYKYCVLRASRYVLNIMHIVGSWKRLQDLPVTCKVKCKQPYTRTVPKNHAQSQNVIWHTALKRRRASRCSSRSVWYLLYNRKRAQRQKDTYLEQATLTIRPLVVQYHHHNNKENSMPQDARGMTKINFRVSEELDRRLRIVAANQRRTRSEILVEIVKKYVEWCEKKGYGEAKWIKIFRRNARIH